MILLQRVVLYILFTLLVLEDVIGSDVGKAVFWPTLYMYFTHALSGQPDT